MIFNFAYCTTDEHLWEALQGLPGAITVVCLPLNPMRIVFDSRQDKMINFGYLITATGKAESALAWSERCQCAIDEAQQLLAGAAWIVDDIDLEGI